MLRDLQTRELLRGSQHKYHSGPRTKGYEKTAQGTMTLVAALRIVDIGAGGGNPPAGT